MLGDTTLAFFLSDHMNVELMKPILFKGRNQFQSLGCTQLKAEMLLFRVDKGQLAIYCIIEISIGTNIATFFVLMNVDYCTLSCNRFAILGGKPLNKLGQNWSLLEFGEMRKSLYRATNTYKLSGSLGI